MIFHRIALLSAGLLATSVALTGCSDDPEPTEPSPTPVVTEQASPEPSPEPTPEVTEEPTTEPSPAAEQTPLAAGETFTGTGYELVVPEGWVTDPSLAGGAIDVMLTRAEVETVDAITVSTTPAEGLTLDALLPEAKKTLEGHATEIADAPEITVDGRPARGFTGVATQGAAPFVQYYVLHADRLHTIDFAGPDGVQAVEAVTGGWTFSN